MSGTTDVSFTHINTGHHKLPDNTCLTQSGIYTALQEMENEERFFILRLSAIFKSISGQNPDRIPFHRICTAVPPYSARLEVT